MWFDDYHDDFDDDIDDDEYLFDVDSGDDDYIMHGGPHLIGFELECVSGLAAAEAHPDDDSTKDDIEAELDSKREGLVADHLSGFTNNPKYSDVILQVGKHLFHGHKIILCSWSEVFRKMFIDPSWTSCHQDTPNAGGGPKLQQLVESEECADVFQTFLKFMYSETVVLNIENVYPILTLADKYMVQDLRDLCEDFLLDQVSNVSCEEAMRGYFEAERLGLVRVQDQCVRIFEANINYLQESVVQGMSSDLLLRLLHSSDLVIEEENDVFKIALQWLNTDGQQEARKGLAREIFSLIRFPHMPSSRLKSLVDLPLPNFLEAEFHPLLAELVAKAFAWRALAAEEAFSDMDDDFVQPRMYHSQTFCLPSFKGIMGHANSDSFSKMVVAPEGQDEYYNRKNFPVASRAEKNIYRFGKNAWEVNVFSSRNLASTQWSLSFVIQTSKDLGHYYRVALMTRLTEEEDDDVNPLISLHHGTVGRKMTLTPSSTAKLSERPAKVWIKMVGFVDGKSESPHSSSLAVAAVC